MIVNEFNDQDDFGEGFQGPDDGTTDSSIEVKDIVQAFNPYVKVIWFDLNSRNTLI